MKYIGMDAHASNCTLCVMDRKGMITDNAVLETNGRLLVGYLRSIEGRKKLTFEECELSGWLYEILKGEVEEVVVCNPVFNKEYKRAKTDKLDAKKLANLLRGDFLTPVYHDGSKRERFRALVYAYIDLVEDGVRLKNRHKSLFRKEGIFPKGKAVYHDESLLTNLKRSDFKFIGKNTLKLLKSMEDIRHDYVAEIEKMSKNFKEIEYLKTIPGIKTIQAAKIVSQVIDPYRFSSKYKFFSYCGLARHKRISGGKEIGSEKIWGNRTLKCVYKMVAHQALRSNTALKEYYLFKRKKGLSHQAAYNSLSRKIASISLYIWKRGEIYRDEIVKKCLISHDDLL